MMVKRIVRVRIAHKWGHGEWFPASAAVLWSIGIFIWTFAGAAIEV